MIRQKTSRRWLRIANNSAFSKKEAFKLGFFSIFIDIFLQLWYYISGKRFRLSTNHCAFLKVKTTISYKTDSSFILQF